MEYENYSQCSHVNMEVVDEIVCKLKSQGIFDQFRKDCLADVDTKPAYQNLQQRVNSTVSTFLAKHKWTQDLNKNQLRENLRRHVQKGYLETGVDRIVDQVVNPRICPVFLPCVEDLVYDQLGLEKPKPLKDSKSSLNAEYKSNQSGEGILPTDLDPVSPESDCNENVKEREVKEEPQPLVRENELSNDSHLSGISELTSHGSIKDISESAQTDVDKARFELSNDTYGGPRTPLGEPEKTEEEYDNFSNLKEKLAKAEIALKKYSSDEDSPPPITSPIQPHQSDDEFQVKNSDELVCVNGEKKPSPVKKISETSADGVTKGSSNVYSDDSKSCDSRKLKRKNGFVTHDQAKVHKGDNDVDVSSSKKQETELPSSDNKSDNTSSDKESKKSSSTDKEVKKSDSSRDRKHSSHRSRSHARREDDKSKSRSDHSKDSKHRSSQDKSKSRHRDDNKSSSAKKDDRRSDKDKKDRHSDKKSDRRDKERSSNDKSRSDKSKSSEGKSSSDKQRSRDKDRDSRKRKGDRCKDDVKSKDARRSSDRDSSGRGSGNKTSEAKPTSDNRTETKESEVSSAQEKPSNNEQQQDVSDIDVILEKLNASILKNSEDSNEPGVLSPVTKKKPKIANSVFEIHKIMQVRKSMERKKSKSGEEMIKPNLVNENVDPNLESYSIEVKETVLGVPEAEDDEIEEPMEMDAMSPLHTMKMIENLNRAKIKICEAVEEVERNLNEEKMVVEENIPETEDNEYKKHHITTFEGNVTQDGKEEAETKCPDTTQEEVCSISEVQVEPNENQDDHLTSETEVDDLKVEEDAQYDSGICDDKDRLNSEEDNMVSSVQVSATSSYEDLTICEEKKEEEMKQEEQQSSPEVNLDKAEPSLPVEGASTESSETDSSDANNQQKPAEEPLNDDPNSCPESLEGAPYLSDEEDFLGFSEEEISKARFRFLKFCGFPGFTQEEIAESRKIYETAIALCEQTESLELQPKCFVTGQVLFDKNLNAIEMGSLVSTRKQKREGVLIEEKHFNADESIDNVSVDETSVENESNNSLDTKAPKVGKRTARGKRSVDEHEGGTVEKRKIATRSSGIMASGASRDSTPTVRRVSARQEKPTSSKQAKPVTTRQKEKRTPASSKASTSTPTTRRNKGTPGTKGAKRKR